MSVVPTELTGGLELGTRPEDSEKVRENIKEAERMTDYRHTKKWRGVPMSPVPRVCVRGSVDRYVYIRPCLEGKGKCAVSYLHRAQCQGDRTSLLFMQSCLPPPPPPSPSVPLSALQVAQDLGRELQSVSRHPGRS